MTVKQHYLAAATDGSTLTRLKNIYAATQEEAWHLASIWHEDPCPELPSLRLRHQPQGFQAGFTRLPGWIDDEHPCGIIYAGMQVVYVPKETQREQQ